MRNWLLQLFIPRVENHYEPYSLRAQASLMMFVLVVLSFVTANLQIIFWQSSDWLLTSVLPGVVVNDTNVKRGEASLTPLRNNPALAKAAQMKAEHMAKNGYFAHYSPDGVSPWYWFKAVGYDFVNAGENLAVHFNDSSEVVQAWMNSPTHRANIMNGSFTEIGIGVAEGQFEGSSTVFVVQFFGTPAVAAAATNSDVNTESITVVKETVTKPLAQPIETEGVASAETVVTSEVVPIDVSTDTQKSVYMGTVTVAPDTEPVVLQGEEVSTKSRLAILTQPMVLVQILYVFLGLLVVISLLLSILIEIRKQNPMQIAYGVGLLFIMTGLWYLQDYLSGGVVVV